MKTVRPQVILALVLAAFAALPLAAAPAASAPGVSAPVPSPLPWEQATTSGTTASPALPFFLTAAPPRVQPADCLPEPEFCCVEVYQQGCFVCVQPRCDP